MSEPIKKADKTTPESYSPKTPTFLSMMGEAQDGATQQAMTEAGLMSFEVVKSGPYRFVGKSVYERAFGKLGVIDGSGNSEIVDGIWKLCGTRKVFEELDGMKDYASDETYNVTLRTWDRYDDKNQLMGHTVGRFMKADMPVPDGMDYIDIPEVHIAKAWKYDADRRPGDIAGGPGLDELDRMGIYKSATWMFEAGIYLPPDENGTPLYGWYCAVLPLTDEEKAERAKGK